MTILCCAMPQFPCVCRRVHCKVKNLFVESLQPCKVRSLAQCDCIAEDCLDSTQPCRAEAKMIYRKFRCLIIQCGAEKLCFSAKRFCGFTLYDFLVLLLRESQLPGNPSDAASRREPLMYNAEQSHAGHCVSIQVFSWVVSLKILGKLCDRCGVQARRRMFCPTIQRQLLCCAGFRRGSRQFRCLCQSFAPVPGSAQSGHSWAMLRFVYAQILPELCISRGVAETAEV